MGRGVMTVSDAVVAYVHLPEYEDDSDWDNFIWQVRWAVTEKWPSFYEVDEWDGREKHRILQNDLCRIVVCEYCGVASINLAIRESLWQYTPDLTPLAKRFQGQIASHFIKWMSENFDCLAKQGTMSNGVSVYTRM
jgi:hypothetical protein